MKKSKSSRRWLQEHFSDEYVKQAQRDGYRSRSAYKLLELQERNRIFKPGMTVVDLGAAPGGWSQCIIHWVGSKGRVIAVDLLPIAPLPGVEIIQGDFSTDEILQSILEKLSGKSVDWVVSDMAPNLTGIASADQARAIALAELALDFAVRVLNDSGGFLVKSFQGEGFEAYLRDMRKHFKKVAIRKPKASRGRSSEVYLLATGFVR